MKTADKGVDQSPRVAAKFQNCIACHQTRPSGPLPPSHLDVTASATVPPPSEPGKAAVNDPGDRDMKDKGMGIKEMGLRVIVWVNFSLSAACR